MKIKQLEFTEIYMKVTDDHLLELVFYDVADPGHALLMRHLSFYWINTPGKINVVGYNKLQWSRLSSPGTIDRISHNDLHDNIYLQINGDTVFLITGTFDNVTGDSYQYLRIFSSNTGVYGLEINDLEFAELLAAANTAVESEADDMTLA